MTALLTLTLTLALVLLPLALIAWRQGSSRSARLRRAWHEAWEKEQGKTETLTTIEQRLARSIEAEQALLDRVQQLRQHIAELPADAPDKERLQRIDQGTEAAINSLAEIVELQVDTEGQARLQHAANRLAEAHADSSTAIARLEDMQNEGSAPQRSADAASDTANTPPETDDPQPVDANRIGLLLQQDAPGPEHRVH